MPITSFAGLSDEAWNELAGSHFYSRTEWLRYCTAETQMAGDAVVVRDATGEVAVAAPVRELGGLADWSRYRWNGYLGRAGLPQLAPHGVLVGPSEGFQTHLLTGTELEVGKVAEFIDAVRERSGRQGNPAVAMFVSTDDARLLVEAGITHVPILLEGDAWLEIPEGGWDEYLAKFRNKQRHTIRMERRKFTDANLTVSHVALKECWQLLGEASVSLLRKYGHDATLEGEFACMRHMIDELGDRARVAVCHESGAFEKLSGFCVYYEHGDTVYLRWPGFDRTRLRGVYEYFNTLFYSQIERARETGIRWLHAGAAASPAKALRGARLRPLWLVDLSTESPLSQATTQIEHHNRTVLAEFLADRRTANAVEPLREWTAFTHADQGSEPQPKGLGKEQ